MEDTYILLGKTLELLEVASKEIGLKVNAEKSKYMVTSRDQHARQNHNNKIANKCFEKLEQFRYLGATVTNENSIYVEIKSGQKSGNACYHTMQNLLSSTFLSKYTGCFTTLGHNCRR